MTAGGGQHHGTCLNNLIRRKQKPEFDKFSSVGPLNWKCLRLVKIPCGFVGQSGRVRKTEDGVIQSRPRYHWLRWQVFESWTMYSANIRRKDNSMKWKLYYSTDELKVINQNTTCLMKTEEQSTKFGLKKKLVVHCTIKVIGYYLSLLSSNLTSLKI